MVGVGGRWRRRTASKRRCVVAFVVLFCSSHLGAIWDPPEARPPQPIPLRHGPSLDDTARPRASSSVTTTAHLSTTRLSATFLQNQYSSFFLKALSVICLEKVCYEQRIRPHHDILTRRGVCR
ncbi:hypothetical protein JOL62DRAFT_603804 [Phyllosticta paracitricarpa]|uniref:Secreted protein n=1 Tax=Phyllosticta paracitricarpa TaxID=2016321 RepID=A0ABR1NAF8_9PEZI